MAEFTIRPTTKWARFQFTLVLMIFCVCVGVWVNKFQDQVDWRFLIIPALLFLWPLKTHIRLRFTKMTIAGDKLHYETGIFSKTMRTIQMSKVQDVRIDQTLVQRMMQIGNLSIETAGETSRLTIEDIDSPRAVADAILDAAPAAHPQKRKSEGL
jgi:uncharacterized membrane protein YdbT with pleckstrin-like domain